MSKFHFNESAMSEVAASLSSVSGTISIEHLLLLSRLSNNKTQNGFGIENSLSALQDVINCDFGLLERLHASADAIASIISSISSHCIYVVDDNGELTSIASLKNPLKDFNGRELNALNARYSHDTEKITGQFLDVIIDATGLNVSNIDKDAAVFISGLDDVLGNLGVDENAYGEIYSFLKETSSDGNSIDEMEWQGKIATMAFDEKFPKSFSTILKGVNDINDFTMECLSVAAGKYVAVSKYLDTLYDSYNGNEKMQMIIDSYRFTYEDKYGAMVLWVLKEGGNHTTSEVIKKIEKFALKDAASYLQATNLSFKITNKVLKYDDITTAYNKLNGVDNIRKQAENSYNQLFEKIQKGNYTQEDINNANNLFDIYKEASISEYKSLIEIESLKCKKETNWAISPGNITHIDEIKTAHTQQISKYETEISRIADIDNPLADLKV